MYWNGKCSLNIHGLCNGIVKQKDIFFSILCEPCWKVWGNCCVIENIFLMNRAMKRMGCTDSQSQHWHWNEIEQYRQNSHHLVHKHVAFFSPLCISLFPPKCSCEINGRSNRWIIYREVILLVAEEVQGGICAEQNSGALFSKRKFQSNVFDLIMMNLWQWS